MTEKRRRVKKPWFRKPALNVSNRMKRVKSFGTSIEKRMEFLLKDSRIEYKKQPKLFGKPDFQIKRTNALIFCDSSFWHGRRKKEISGEAFKKNKDFWVNKLKYNRQRDMRTNRILKKDGWRVLRFWDDDIIKHPWKVIRKLRFAISKYA